MDLNNIGPTSVSAAALLYALGHWAVVGQFVGHRVGMADYHSSCEKNYAQEIEKSATDRLSKIERPSNGAELNIARNMANSPLLKFAEEASRYGLQPGQQNPLGQLLGINPFKVTEDGLGILEAKHRQAKQAYETSVASIRSWAAREAANAGTACEKAIINAVEENRNQWALYTGTIGFVKPAEIINFDDQIKEQLTSQGAG